MKKNGRSTPAPAGLVLYAKPSGITSFSSLWTIKHALGTDKVGHTGTLDSFADGLLVVLSGQLTHLVPHVTSFAKTYRAVVCFGKETDTLDPCGTVTGRGQAVSRSDLEAVLPQFTGAILQEPPAYSALHVGGKRASDLVRGGKDVHLESRAVFVYVLSLVDFAGQTEADPCSYALLEVTCSKGTYIRSLARDIARVLGTRGHLCALRRTAVGPFLLQDAAGYGSLPDFTIPYATESAARYALLADAASGKKADRDGEELLRAQVRGCFMPFTPELAVRCAFSAETLLPEHERAYRNGRPLSPRMFSRIQSPAAPAADSQSGSAVTAASVTARLKTDRIAVFYDDGSFAGMAEHSGGRLSYGFVVPRKERTLLVLSWQDVLSGAFPREWRRKGTALSVGSFDGMHAGHRALLDAVASQSGLVGGIVTFTSSCRAGTEEPYAGDVATLRQRLSVCGEKGLSFAVVIDFSEQFSRMEGRDFMSLLVERCGMRSLFEGGDFRCGYRGSFGIPEIREFSAEAGFSLSVADDVVVACERVSSSRIRSCVAQGDFPLAQRMLLSPFSYDTEGLVWSRGEASGDGHWFSAPLSGRSQVVPRDGTYACAVLLRGTAEGGGQSVLRTVCAVRDGTLSVVLPSEESAARADAVQFVSV